MMIARSDVMAIDDDDDKVISIQSKLDGGQERLTDTDLANARRFIDQHGDDVRWTPERGWLVWDSCRWQIDDMHQIEAKAKTTVESIFDEIKSAPNRDERFRFAKKSQSARGIKDLLFLARSDPKVTARLVDFDTDPWLFNCTNGTLDLQTGKLLPHSREDMLTRLSPVDYKPEATCELWLKFLRRIMAGNDDLILFLQRAAGYSLTGLVIEQVLFFCYGIGQNGKTVFLEVMQSLLGDYGLNARTETIMARREAGIPNDVARLAGARFVAINETADGQRLHEPLIKDMTGGDTMTARFLHHEHFDFHPIFKLWLRGNHKPQIRGTDEGIWRRIRLIPFTVQIPEAERDRHLAEKLQGELPGILAWAVQGCIDWQKNELGTPEAIIEAVREYREEMDVVGQFIEDRVTIRDNAQVTAKALYGAYRAWADMNGETAATQMRFGLAMIERGYTKKKTKSCIVYLGIELPSCDEGRGGG